MLLNDLEMWVRKLLKEGKIVRFYQSKEWQALRDEVLYEQHYECQRCLERGRYTRAEMVHHVNEVRRVPRLALSKMYVDKDGNEQRNLIALCNDCHEIIHDRLKEWRRKNSDRFENVERW